MGHFAKNKVDFFLPSLPVQGCCSENDSCSVGSRPDIQQKLQEKKRKQLAELKKIEEEIKLGKLHQRPNSTPVLQPSQPPPPQDKQTPHYETPEILLAPRFLETTAATAAAAAVATASANGEENHYYEWSIPTSDNPPGYR